MSEYDDREELIEAYNRRLKYLKRQKALFGISTPPEIHIENEDITAQIEKLQSEQEAQAIGCCLLMILATITIASAGLCYF